MKFNAGIAVLFALVLIACGRHEALITVADGGVGGRGGVNAVNAGGQQTDAQAQDAQGGIEGPIACDGRATSLVAAQFAICARRVDGKVLCWGDNEGGTIGHSVYRPLSKPFVLPDMEGVLALEGNNTLVCASFMNDKKAAVCWGSMRFADGTRTFLQSPTALPESLTGQKRILGDGICALNDGRLTCWGGLGRSQCC